MFVKTWHVEMFISEDGDDTTVRAVLHGDSAMHPEGIGRARRAPSDPSVPEVGDEIAAARALHALADALLSTAAKDIEAYEHHPVQLDMSGPAGVSTRSRTLLPRPSRPTR
jgi:hypothetical protein